MARVADLKVYYFDPLSEYVDVEAEEAAGGFANEIQYWKDCYTSPITEEKYPFENNGAKENTFEDCGLKCVQENFQYYAKTVEY